MAAQTILEDGKIAEDLAKFFDTEDIIAKLHTIQAAEQQSPYEPNPQHVSYWNRIQRSLRHIPSRYHQAAYAIYANVIYVTDDLRAEASRFLASTIANWANDKGFHIPEDAHIFGVDHHRLVEEIYDVGHEFGWSARQDQLPQRDHSTVSAFLQLVNQDAGVELSRDALLSNPIIRAILEKKFWVVLNDNALSGGSVTTDVQRLIRLLDILQPHHRPEIVIAGQVITDQAIESLLQSPLKFPRDRIFYGLYFDDRTRITSNRCELFSSPKVCDEVRSLCRWFGEEYFRPREGGNTPTTAPAVGPWSDANREAYAVMRATVEKHAQRGGDANFSYGWLDGGYTIIIHKNAPTNSVPLLWYPASPPPSHPTDSHDYAPPFPRRHSRTMQITAGSDSLLDRLESRYPSSNVVQTEGA